MKLSWSAAPGKVQQYFITYTPVVGGETKELTVKGDTTSKVLKGLDEATRYALTVSALYASGAGEALYGEGETLEGNFFVCLFVSAQSFIYLYGCCLSCLKTYCLPEISTEVDK